MAIPSEFPFLHCCILDSVANLLVRHMVFVGNVQKSPIASQLKGSSSAVKVQLSQA